MGSPFTFSNITYIDNDTTTLNGNHYGGNYIASPNNKIFTFDESSELLGCIQQNLISKIVPLKSSII